jgi:hypothetical protein
VCVAGTGLGQAPLPLPRAGGCRPGLLPRVFSAHRYAPQLQVHAPASGVTPHPLAKRLQTGPAFLHMPIFTIWPDLVPIQTGAPAYIRSSGPWIALPAHRLYYPVDMWPRSTTRGFWGDLRGAAMAISATASVSACGASWFVARVRASREEKTASSIPAESHVAVCMPTASKEAI